MHLLSSAGCSRAMYTLQQTSNVVAVQEPLRPTFHYRFHRDEHKPLRKLAKVVVENCYGDFQRTYGYILQLLDDMEEPWALPTLLQFYDPQLRCFTFTDYQLLPTLEEYSSLLGIKIQDKPPFEKVPQTKNTAALAKALHLSMGEVSQFWRASAGIFGFGVKFLVRKAEEAATAQNWVALNARVAALIYGLVMFPNLQLSNFVDSTAWYLFVEGNPVPTLLADTYYSIHTKHGSDGTIAGYLPILYKWFMSHLPVRGHFKDTKDLLKFSQRIMGLTSHDITWYDPGLCVRNVIASCRQFHNVPLVGTKGCINYNPMLELRQLGFPMNAPPAERHIAETVCCDKKKDPIRAQEAWAAWKAVRRKDKSVLGPRGTEVSESYTAWVKERAKLIMMPYPKEAPLYRQPPAVKPDVVIADRYIQMQKELTQL